MSSPSPASNLNLITSTEGIVMDSDKVTVIRDWELPSLVKKYSHFSVSATSLALPEELQQDRALVHALEDSVSTFSFSFMKTPTPQLAYSTLMMIEI
jgi:hypothetical protein